jgi:hypothetical protein
MTLKKEREREKILQDIERIDQMMVDQFWQYSFFGKVTDKSNEPQE